MSVSMSVCPLVFCYHVCGTLLFTVKKRRKEKKKHVNMKKIKLSMTDIEVMRTNNN